jgi:ATP-dependent DNA helicase RecQ
MAETTAQRIRTIADSLVGDACLLSQGDEYPVLVLGPAAEEVLREQRKVVIKLPKERAPKPAEESLWQKTEPERSGRSAKATGSRGSPQEPTAIFENDDKALFEQLKDLRREFAAKEGVPAYIVFSDASLRDMCRKKPVSLVQFSAVNGVGSVKLEKYGEAFVALIAGLSSRAGR